MSKIGPFQHLPSRKAGFCALLMILPLVGAAQTHQDRLFFGFNLSGSGFSHIQGATPVVSPELRARWEFSVVSAIEAAASMAEFRQNFDTPNGLGSLDLQSWWAEVGFAHQILMIGESLGLHGSLGGGITTVHRPEVSIPLGALGTTTVPATTDSRAHLTAGIRLAQEVLNMITLNVGTNLRLLSPLSEPEMGYSVFGGLSVEVL